MTYILIHCSLSSYTSTFKFHNLCIVLTKIEVWINWSRLLTTNYLIRTLSKHREIAVRVYEMHHLYVELKEINSKIKSRQGIRIMCHVSRVMSLALHPTETHGKLWKSVVPGLSLPTIFSPMMEVAKLPSTSYRSTKGGGETVQSEQPGKEKERTLVREDSREREENFCFCLGHPG